MHFVFYLCAVFLSYSMCLVASASPSSVDSSRIVGGNETEITQFPYLAYIHIEETHNKMTHCGGSIISNDWILTAAHCIIYAIDGSLVARVGSSFAYDGGETIPIKLAIQHEKYDPKTGDYDVALLKLNIPLNWTNEIGYILLSRDEVVVDGDECYTTGWGQIETDVTLPAPKKLRTVMVPYFDKEKCKKFYSKRVLTDRMVCAGYDNGESKGTCRGDSGGPLVCKERLFGVTSFGKHKCGHRPDVYASVQSVRDWITDKTGIYWPPM